MALILLVHSAKPVSGFGRSIERELEMLDRRSMPPRGRWGGPYIHRRKVGNEAKVTVQSNDGTLEV